MNLWKTAIAIVVGVIISAGAVLADDMKIDGTSKETFAQSAKEMEESVPERSLD